MFHFDLKNILFLLNINNLWKLVFHKYNKLLPIRILQTKSYAVYF